MRAKRLILSMVVMAAALMWTSCGKEEIVPSESHIIGNMMAGDNIAVINGILYHGILMGSSNGYTPTGYRSKYLSFSFSDNNGLILGGVLYGDAVNTTIDLTEHNSDIRYYICGYSNLLDFCQKNETDVFDCMLDQVFLDESVFLDGTMTTSYDSTHFSCTLKGTLKNGIEIAYKVNTNDI